MPVGAGGGKEGASRRSVGAPEPVNESDTPGDLRLLRDAANPGRLGGLVQEDIGSRSASAHDGRYEACSRTDSISKLRAGVLNALFTVLPLGTSMNGPTSIMSSGTYTWTASPSGGDGAYTYQWAYRNYGSSTWVGLGSGSTQSREILASTLNFTIRVIVTDRGRAVSAQLAVTNDQGQCTPFC